MRIRSQHLPRCLAFACCVSVAACGGSPGTAGPEQTSISPPTLLMVDGSHVADVSVSLRRGEPQFRPALNALEADANEALSVEQMSVMDKDVTPPSGDKHYYMSQAPYYWPNPSKPDGLPYILKDGQRNPEVDRITDHEELGRLRTVVSSLGLAFYLTGRQDY